MWATYPPTPQKRLKTSKKDKIQSVIPKMYKHKKAPNQNKLIECLICLVGG